jgi:superfamily II DNA or RNA helicase
MNNQEKGLLYEKYIKDFIIQKIGKNAYLWNECPENILIDNVLVDSHNDMRLIRKDIKEGYLHTHKDIGIDIIQLDNNRCSIVQCKNGYSNGLCVDDISGIMMRSNFMRDVPTFIYYTNCLSRNVKYTSILSPYVVNIDCSVNIDKLLEVSIDNKIYFVKLPYEDKNNQEITKTEIIPYSYQSEAVAKFKEHFENNNRGILSLPCGCGKTYTSYIISYDYSHIIILSPLREFASQNLNRFIKYGYDKNNTLLVDSDGNRDIDSIKEIIKNKNKLLISCTYNSMDLITECLELFKDALFIVDEFHNLSKANISDDENHIFKLLMSDYKILFMSATPRIYDIEYDDEAFDMEWLFGDVVYQMTFTDAIANKYITDYKIWLPSIHENNEELDKELSIYEIDNEIKNRCKFLYSCIANNGSRKCIIYCKDTEDMMSMIECMKTLNEFYIMDIEINSISCEDSEKKRKRTLESFANNNDKIQLLFNIRILNECIDIPSCDSIYISYAPKNKITTIQRISRATRTDKNNPYKVANIYIWCEEYEEILETLSSIKEYDIMFKDKIKVNAVEFYHSKEDKDIELVDNDKVLLSNCIVGVKEFKVMSWEEKLEMVEEYIQENRKLPLSTDKNVVVKQLRNWISHQNKYYKKHIHMFRNIQYVNKWETFIENYSHLFRTNEEQWYDMLECVKHYIYDNNKLPSILDEDPYIQTLYRWVGTQKHKYKNKLQIMNMKNEKIRSTWETFIKDNYILFMSNEELWNENLEQLKQYIEKYNKEPSTIDEDKNIQRLGRWLSTQKKNYKLQIENMKDYETRKVWEDFLQSFSIIKTREDIWLNKFENLKMYIQKHNKLPSDSDNNNQDKILSRWLGTQNKNFKNNKGFMKIHCLKQKWINFKEEFKNIFMSQDEIWKNHIETVEKYIAKHNKLPLSTDKNKEIQKLATWISNQKDNYKFQQNIMLNEDIKQLWINFVEKHKRLFITREEQWIENLHKIDEYIKQHNKLPSKKDTNDDVKTLKIWIYTQKKNYPNMGIMRNNNDIMKLWESFIENNKPLFMTFHEIWNDNLYNLEQYIKTYNKLPSQIDSDINIQQLGGWVSTQKTNFEKHRDIMKDPVIRNKWLDFMNTYPLFFRSNKDIWYDYLQQSSNYIINYKKRPSSTDKNKHIQQLGRWLVTQTKNYNSNKFIMQELEIRQSWEDFTKQYDYIFET